MNTKTNPPRDERWASSSQIRTPRVDDKPSSNIHSTSFQMESKDIAEMCATSYPDIPALPAPALVSETEGVRACPWLDDYIKFSRKWSPMSYDGYHEAIGLFILSTIAARRVAFHFGKLRYTNLYIALVGRTSIHAKTTAAEIGIETLRMAGLDFLLAPDTSTPQSLVKYMATSSLPEGYDKFPEEWKERALFRALTAGQRGWFYDEFGMLVSAMMRSEGVMNDFRGLLRKFDDTPERYESATIIRGHEVIEKPYLALLASLTPADLKPFVKRGAALWGDGFLARFGLVTPPEGCLSNGRFPNEVRKIPEILFTSLRQWHERLGLPKYSFQDMDGKMVLSVQPRPADVLEVSQDVFNAYYNYMEGLREIISQSNDTDLDGNYSRLPEKTLRISALFASLNGSLRIELPDWAKAQAIAERWRAGLHELYTQVGAANDAQPPSSEEKVLRIIRLKQPLTKREIVQSTKIPHEEVMQALSTLLQKSMITIRPNGKTDVYEVLR